MKATLWVEKGKYKPHQKWRMTQKKKKMQLNRMSMFQEEK